MNSPSHPVWGTIRFIVLMTVLTLILFWNANSFDITEIRTIAGMFLTAAGVEVLPHILQRKA